MQWIDAAAIDLLCLLRRDKLFSERSPIDSDTPPELMGEQPPLALLYRR